MITINEPAKAELHCDRDAEPANPSTLIEEVPMLPKRFFTFAQEGIAMLWLNDDPKKPERGEFPRK